MGGACIYSCFEVIWLIPAKVASRSTLRQMLTYGLVLHLQTYTVHLQTYTVQPHKNNNSSHMFIYWSGACEKTFCFLGVASPGLKDAQMYAWKPLLSPGLPTASSVPAYGKKCDFWKERDLMYKLYTSRQKRKGGDSSLICIMEVSNSIPSPGICCSARRCIWSTCLSFNLNGLHRHSGAWEKSYIL